MDYQKEHPKYQKNNKKQIKIKIFFIINNAINNTITYNIPNDNFNNRDFIKDNNKDNNNFDNKDYVEDFINFVSGFVIGSIGDCFIKIENKRNSIKSFRTSLLVINKDINIDNIDEFVQTHWGGRCATTKLN